MAPVRYPQTYWMHGGCGTYARALAMMYPHLQLGALGEQEREDEPGSFLIGHYFAHDGKYAYDAEGRHKLPYKRKEPYYQHQQLDTIDHGIAEEEHEADDDLDDALAAAMRHIRRNQIVEGHGEGNTHTAALGPEERLYHATDKRFRRGQRIKPAAETGHESRWRNAKGYDPDYVYLYASSNPEGTGIEHTMFAHLGDRVYEAEAEGLEPDPEGSSDKAYRARGARVVRRVWPPRQHHEQVRPGKLYHGTNAELERGAIIEPGVAEPTFDYDQLPEHPFLTTSLVKGLELCAVPGR